MGLRFPRFLNLIHTYLIWKIRNTVDTQEQLDQIRSLSEQLTGALTTVRPRVTVNGVTARPPSWWVDDDDATAASFAAMAALRRE